jgi:hypothetical protein
MCILYAACIFYRAHPYRRLPDEIKSFLRVDIYNSAQILTTMHIIDYKSLQYAGWRQYHEKRTTTRVPRVMCFSWSTCLIKSGGVLSDWEMIWSTGDMAPHFLQRAFVFHEKITIYFLPTFESKGFKHIR